MSEKPRYPHYSDIKEVMDNVGGWARNWGDVLWYAEGPAVYDADIARHEVPQLKHFFEDAEKKNVDFTTDYRQVWQAVTGQDTSGMPEPKPPKSYGIDPRRLAKDLQAQVDFPASKSAIVKAAEKKQEPKQALDVLRKIDDRDYDNVWMVIEAVGDQTWDHD